MRFRTLAVVALLTGFQFNFEFKFGIMNEAQAQNLQAQIDQRVQAVTPKVVTWRRDIHQHPELGNRETRTAGVIAAHLRSLGLEVNDECRQNRRGGRTARWTAGRNRRAARGHGCVAGHGDGRSAVQIDREVYIQQVRKSASCTPAATTRMSPCSWAWPKCWPGMKAQIPGTVKFFFQPAEEGTPRRVKPAAPAT